VTRAERPPHHLRARDYHGTVVLDYAPDLDGEPDPGEIVWAWVPFREDPTRGKDRPLVVIGRTDGRAPAAMAGLMLSSKDRSGRSGWVFLGAGGWDERRRDSWVRVDRVFAIPAGAIRREGAVLPPERFLELVEAAVSRGGFPVAGPARPRLSLWARVKQWVRRRS